MHALTNVAPDRARAFNVLLTMPRLNALFSPIANRARTFNVLPVMPRLTALLLVAVVTLTGCSTSDDSDPTETSESESSLLPMTLTGWLFAPGDDPATADPAALLHLSIQPLIPGENDLTIALTSLDGEPLASGDTALDLSWHALSPDAEATSVAPEPVGDEPATWAIEDLELPDPGWYELQVALGNLATGEVHLLLPDPSVHGGDAVDLPETDPDAEALYGQALDAYGSWDAGKWRESLGSGVDVLVVTQYAVTGRDGEPVAMTAHSRYVGSFRPRADGSDVDAPREDFSTRIVNGEQSWSREAGGAWEPQDALPASDFAGRADIYTGATNILPAGTTTIGDTEVEIITFHLPQKGGQAEAWFAWWIDPVTGDPLRMVMIAEMHFMRWDFSEINGEFEITPPTEPATPAG